MKEAGIFSVVGSHLAIVSHHLIPHLPHFKSPQGMYCFRGPKRRDSPQMCMFPLTTHQVLFMLCEQVDDEHHGRPQCGRHRGGPAGVPR